MRQLQSGRQVSRLGNVASIAPPRADACGFHLRPVLRPWPSPATSVPGPSAPATAAMATAAMPPGPGFAGHAIAGPQVDQGTCHTGYIGHTGPKAILANGTRRPQAAPT